jgi:hypothetical protein
VQATRDQLREIIRDMGPHQPGIHVTMTDDPTPHPGGTK